MSSDAMRLKAAQTRAQHAELGALFPLRFCVLTRLPAGPSVEVDLSIAAELIVAASHRLATPEELSAFRASQQNERRAITSKETVKGAAYFLRKDAR
jgi:hypothetical protein